MDGLKRLLSSRKIAAMLCALLASFLVFAATVISKKAGVDIGLDGESAKEIAAFIVGLAAVYAGAQAYEDKEAKAVEGKKLDLEIAKTQAEMKVPKLN